MYFIREERDNGQVFIHRYNRYRKEEEVLYFADHMWEQYISDNEKSHITSFCLMESEPSQSKGEELKTEGRKSEDPDGNDGRIVKRYKGNDRLHDGKEKEL
ncbi:hypothetical protein ACKX2L_06255 [Lachnospiraceae bacterium YH-ros2228]